MSRHINIVEKIKECKVNMILMGNKNHTSLVLACTQHFECTTYHKSTIVNAK
jgi:hypothetical protein